MSKYCGKVGFVYTEETAPGVWTERKVERNYFGDVLRFTGHRRSGEGVNDDVEITSEFSIVADPFAYQYLYAVRYLEWMGTLWKVTTADLQYPRIILTIGGVYNG